MSYKSSAILEPVLEEPQENVEFDVNEHSEDHRGTERCIFDRWCYIYEGLNENSQFVLDLLSESLEESKRIKLEVWGGLPIICLMVMIGYHAVF